MTYFEIFCGAAKNANSNLISALENKIKSREGRKVEPFNLHFCQAPPGESQAHERIIQAYVILLCFSTSQVLCCLQRPSISKKMTTCFIAILY